MARPWWCHWATGEKPPVDLRIHHTGAADAKCVTKKAVVAFANQPSGNRCTPLVMAWPTLNTRWTLHLRHGQNDGGFTHSTQFLLSNDLVPKSWLSFGQPELQYTQAYHRTAKSQVPWARQSTIRQAIGNADVDAEVRSYHRRTHVQAKPDDTWIG